MARISRYQPGYDFGYRSDISTFLSETLPQFLNAERQRQFRTQELKEERSVRAQEAEKDRNVRRAQIEMQREANRLQREQQKEQQKAIVQYRKDDIMLRHKIANAKEEQDLIENEMKLYVARNTLITQMPPGSPSPPEFKYQSKFMQELVGEEARKAPDVSALSDIDKSVYQHLKKKFPGEIVTIDIINTFKQMNPNFGKKKREIKIPSFEEPINLTPRAREIGIGEAALEALFKSLGFNR